MEPGLARILNGHIDMEGEEPESPKPREYYLLHSHHPFLELISFCTRGIDLPHFKTCCEPDHVAELCDLLHADVDGFLWSADTMKFPGSRIREILDELVQRSAVEEDEEAARTIFAVTTQAAYEVMGIYLRQRHLFDRIAPDYKIMPMLASIHPNTEKVMRQMIADSHLGSNTDDGNRVGSKPWFVSDSPANVYARAIICSIQMNQNLEPLHVQRDAWRRFDREHGTRTYLRPLPDYVKGMDELPYSLSPDCVIDFWKKGKEIMLEEIPGFAEFPEWEAYHKRHYAGGAKPGVIRSAIFKDILTALRTMAGSAK